MEVKKTQVNDILQKVVTSVENVWIESLLNAYHSSLCTSQQRDFCNSLYHDEEMLDLSSQQLTLSQMASMM